MIKTIIVLAIIGLGFTAVDKVISKPKTIKSTVRYEDYFIDGNGIITYTKVDKYV